MKPYPVISVKPREGRRARSGSPWLYSNEISVNGIAKALPAGSMVNVVGDDGQVFGTGYFNPKSLIAVRLLSRKADTVVDEAFFTQAFQRAASIRDALLDQPYYRLVNAEGDGLPGLTIDRFGDTLVVQIATAGMELLTRPMLAALEKLFKPKAILLRADMPSRALEGLESYVREVKGSVGRVEIVENGVRYLASLSAGQKTGWYYDQRDNRAFVARLAKGRSVLDAYCYCGGFALAAAHAGARDVTGIDSSEPAIALATEAAASGKLTAKFVEADAMTMLQELGAAGEKFDVVIADPPPFVKSRKDVEVGAKAYRKLAKLAAAVTAPGGFLVLASCSHNIPADRFAFECAAGISRAGRTARQIHASGAGFDHPTHPMLPESGYLKAFVYAVD